MPKDQIITVDTSQAEKLIENRIGSLVRYERDRAQRPLPDVTPAKAALTRLFPVEAPRIFAMPPHRWVLHFYPLMDALPEIDWSQDYDSQPAAIAQKALSTLISYEAIADSSSNDRVPQLLAEIPKLQAIVQERSVQAAQTVADALERAIAAAAWKGSPVTVEADIPGPDSTSDDWAAIAGLHVKVGRDVSKYEGAPTFTLFFDPIQVDDVIEGGDTDFFRNAAEQADYFTLINEIRRPGSSAKPGRTLTLYTARPKKDRGLFLSSRTLPANLFFTTSFDEAEGMARDFGQRDVWKVRVSSKGMVQTLDAPNVKHYQIGDPNGIEAIADPELLMTWEDMAR